MPSSLLLVSPDGGLIALVGAGATTRLWHTTDPRRPALLAVLTGGTPGAFGPTGRTLATVGHDGAIHLRDVDPARVAAGVEQDEAAGWSGTVSGRGSAAVGGAGTGSSPR